MWQQKRNIVRFLREKLMYIIVDLATRSKVAKIIVVYSCKVCRVGECWPDWANRIFARKICLNPVGISRNNANPNNV